MARDWLVTRDLCMPNISPLEVMARMLVAVSPSPSEAVLA